MSIHIKITLGWYLLTSYPDYCNIIFSVVSDSSLMLTSRISPQIIHHLLISGKLSPTSDQFKLLSPLTYSYFTVYIFLICCKNRNTRNRFWMYVHHEVKDVNGLKMLRFSGCIFIFLCLYPHFVPASYVETEIQELGEDSVLIHVFMD